MPTKHDPNGWGWFWLSWLAVGGIVELYWIVVNAANTLSRETWGIEGLNFKHPLDFAAWSPMHWTIAIMLWLFFAWLSLHLPFGYLRG